MEPTKYETSPELPEPIAEGSPDTATNSTPETASNNASMMPNTPSVTPQPDPINTFTPPTSNIQPAVTAQGTLSPQVNAALIADDADLIEKEWVMKAKAIVAQTAHDPNVQSKEVGKVKAEYLKKRYNKQLKIEEN